MINFKDHGPGISEIFINHSSLASLILILQQTIAILLITY